MRTVVGWGCVARRLAHRPVGPCHPSPSPPAVSRLWPPRVSRPTFFAEHHPTTHFATAEPRLFGSAHRPACTVSQPARRVRGSLEKSPRQRRFRPQCAPLVIALSRAALEASGRRGGSTRLFTKSRTMITEALRRQPVDLRHRNFRTRGKSRHLFYFNTFVERGATY